MSELTKVDRCPSTNVRKLSNEELRHELVRAELDLGNFMGSRKGQGQCQRWHDKLLAESIRRVSENRKGHSSPVPEGPRETSEQTSMRLQAEMKAQFDKRLTQGEPERCNCRVSTGICGSITRGKGKLDFNGYWEIECPHGRAFEDEPPAQPSPVVQLSQQVSSGKKSAADWVIHAEPSAPVVPVEETKRLQDEIDRLRELISEVVGICAPGPLGHFRRLDKIFGRIMDVQTRALHFEQWKEANPALPATEKEN